MAEGRQRHDWAIASTVMALFANAHRDPKRTRPLKPSDFDPFGHAVKAPLPKVPITVLRDVFIDGRMPDIRSAV